MNARSEFPYFFVGISVGGIFFDLEREFGSSILLVQRQFLNKIVESVSIHKFV